MARGGQLQVSVKVDAERTSREFKDARRDLNRRLRAALKQAAERKALPAARAVAWGFVAPLLTVRATSRSAYITARGPRRLGRAAGLLEFGGVRRDTIRVREPGPGSGLFVGDGLFRATVTGPRTYRPSYRMTTAVHARRSAIEQAILEEVMQAFDPIPHTP